MLFMKTMRICFVGDSFVNGTGDAECLGWTGRVCAEACGQGHDVTYYNLGVRRDTTDDILARWRAEVERRLPATAERRIVFSFGVNDVSVDGDEVRVPRERSLANARSILSEAAGICPVLMVGPPPTADDEINGRAAKLDAEFSGLCEELNVPYLPVTESLARSGVWTAEATENDGSHPRSGGYAELATLVDNWWAWKAWFD